MKWTLNHTSVNGEHVSYDTPVKQYENCTLDMSDCCLYVYQGQKLIIVLEQVKVSTHFKGLSITGFIKKYRDRKGHNTQVYYLPQRFWAYATGLNDTDEPSTFTNLTKKQLER